MLKKILFAIGCFTFAISAFAADYPSSQYVNVTYRDGSRGATTIPTVRAIGLDGTLPVTTVSSANFVANQYAITVSTNGTVTPSLQIVGKNSAGTWVTYSVTIP